MTAMTTQNYDLAMLAVMAIAILYGGWKGLAWQIASLAAIFASYFMAYHFRYTFAAWIPLKSPADVLLAMLFLYILGSAGIWVIFQWTARYIDRLRLRRFDRLLGALIGGIKGVIFCAVITIFAVTLLGEKQRETIVHSGSGFSVAVMLENVQALLPEEIREAIAPYWRVLDQRLEQGHFEQGGAAPSSVSDASLAALIRHRVGSVCGRPFVSWRAAIATSLACSSDVAPAGQAGLGPAGFSGKTRPNPNIRNIIRRCGEAGIAAV